MENGMHIGQVETGLEKALDSGKGEVGKIGIQASAEVRDKVEVVVYTPPTMETYRAFMEPASLSFND